MKNIKASSDEFIKIFTSREQKLILNKISSKMNRAAKCFESKRYGVEYENCSNKNIF